ncbi:MAG TPA: hypothetical protein VMR97_01090 [Acidimicrobiales bacterium]|nr:hypothetical protein [Acidimicrobiales bacterium]
MTAEGPNAGQMSSAELVESMASSSADLWHEIFQRLEAAQEGQARVAQAVDDLDAAAATVLAGEPETETAEAAKAEAEKAEAARAEAARAEAAKAEAARAEAAKAEAEKAEAARAEAAKAEAEKAEAEKAEAAKAEAERAEAEKAEAAKAEAEKAEAEKATTGPVVAAAELEEAAPPIPEPDELVAALAEPEEWVAAVPTSAEESRGTLSGVRVLAPERAVDMSPAVVDALLAAEFGEAAARIMDPSTLTLDALLGEEFARKEHTASGDAITEATQEPATEEPAPAEEPTGEQAAEDEEAEPQPRQEQASEERSAETELPQPPTRPLPPPPTSLLPPPPSAAASGTSHPAPPAQARAGSDENPQVSSSLKPLSYVQVSPPPQTVDSPPLPAPEPASPKVSGIGTAFKPGDLPPLSFDTELTVAEPALPEEAPPVPDLGASARAEDTLTESGPQEEASPFNVATDLPPLSFDTQLTVKEPALPEEAPPIPGGEPAGWHEEPMEPTDTGPVPSRASMATEILAATPEEPRPVPSAQAEPEQTEDPLGANVVSQDFTIISKKHVKRFRLR